MSLSHPGHLYEQPGGVHVPAMGEPPLCSQTLERVLVPQESAWRPGEEPYSLSLDSAGCPQAARFPLPHSLSYSRNLPLGPGPGDTGRRHAVGVGVQGPQNGEGGGRKEHPIPSKAPTETEVTGEGERRVGTGAPLPSY